MNPDLITVLWVCGSLIVVLIALLVWRLIRLHQANRFLTTDRHLIMSITEWIMTNGSTPTAEAFRMELVKRMRQGAERDADARKYEPFAH